MPWPALLRSHPPPLPVLAQISNRPSAKLIMHAPPLPSTIVLLCAMSSFGLTSALPTEPVKTEQTVELYKLPAYDDFEGFTAPAERKDCGWLDMDYDADDWTGGRSGENEIYSRRWVEDEDNIHHGRK